MYDICLCITRVQGLPGGQKGELKLGVKDSCELLLGCWK